MTMPNEYAVELATSNIRFGPGVTREIGMDLSDMGLKRVMVVSDPYIVKLPFAQAALEAIENEKIEFKLYDKVRVEPTDKSFQDAIQFANAGEFDSFVANWIAS